MVSASFLKIIVSQHSSFMYPQRQVKSQKHTEEDTDRPNHPWYYRRCKHGLGNLKVCVAWFQNLPILTLQDLQRTTAREKQSENPIVHKTCQEQAHVEVQIKTGLEKPIYTHGIKPAGTWTTKAHGVRQERH